MRVVHVIARINVGGTARWLEVLTTELLSRGHEVTILTGHVQEGEEEDPAVERLPIVRVPTLGRSVAPRNDLRSLRQVRCILRDLHPDLVNTHTAKAGVVGRLAVRSLGPRRPALVHTIHGHLLQGYFSRRTVRAITLVERALASASDLVLAAGSEVAADLVDAGMVSESKLRVVLPGVVDVPTVDRGAARDRLGLSARVGDHVVAGWLARITEVKRPDRLIEAARLAPDVLFLVGGDGPDRPEMEANAPDNVIFLGWTSPEVFWSACDLAILSSDNEAVPYSLIEAGLAGLPSVATRVGGVEEVVLDGLTGVLVHPDSRQLASGIRSLANDVRARDALGAAARQHVLSKFSPGVMAERHLEVYSEAVRIRKK